MASKYVFDHVELSHSYYLIETAIDLALSGNVNPNYIKWLVDEAVEQKKSEAFK